MRGGFDRARRVAEAESPDGVPAARLASLAARIDAMVAEERGVPLCAACTLALSVNVTNPYPRARDRPRGALMKVSTIVPKGEKACWSISSVQFSPRPPTRTPASRSRDAILFMSFYGGARPSYCSIRRVVGRPNGAGA